MAVRVAVTGAGGFIGRALVSALLERGNGVVALGRHPQALRFADGVVCRRFDPNESTPQPEAFDGVDAVIHLAGETVAGRWIEGKKREIRESRVAGTQHLVASLEASTNRPTTLISASAVGLYGSRGDDPLFEYSDPGTDFLARVCVDWENALRAAERIGVRTAYLRTGIVLGKGGALTSMAPPFRFGLGGPFGSGRQFVPWIHIDDLVALYLFALDNDLAGAINAVAPDYATSARFSQALGAALGRPALIPAPAFALHAVLGEFASTILASQLVIPARAERAGFSWRHPNLEGAMARALGSPLPPPYGVSLFESRQTVKAPLQDVFTFFSNPRNLQQLTPSALNFLITNCPETVEQGARISYRLRLRGVPIRWETLIARWQPPNGFVDFQLHGPYALWRHEHTFREVPGGVELIDRVQYVLPFAPFTKLAMPLVRGDVERIFAFRRQAIAAQLSS